MRIIFKMVIFGFKVFTYEPVHDKTNKMTCAPSEDSGQPGHPPSLIRVFAVRIEETLCPKLPNERTAKTLIRLGECPGWSESLLGAQVILLVCCAQAHIYVSGQSAIWVHRWTWHTYCMCSRDDCEEFSKQRTWRSHAFYNYWIIRMTFSQCTIKLTWFSLINFASLINTPTLFCGKRWQNATNIGIRTTEFLIHVFAQNLSQKHQSWDL